MQSALVPFYLDPREVRSIDFASGVEGTTEAYWSSSLEIIRGDTQRFYDSLRQAGVVNIAVFALAPIPHLVALGSCLSNKFPTTLYQRHRDTGDWRWKEDSNPVEFRCRILREGAEPQRVALVCSLSGAVPIADYPSAVDGSFTVYEITPDGLDPSFDCLRTRGKFGGLPRRATESTLQRVTSRHPGVQEIHLIPALPSPASRGGGAGLDAKGASSPHCVRQARCRRLRKDDRGRGALGLHTDDFLRRVRST